MCSRENLEGNLEGKSRGKISREISRGNLEGKSRGKISRENLEGNLEGNLEEEISRENLEGKSRGKISRENLEGKSWGKISRENLEGKSRVSVFRCGKISRKNFVKLAAKENRKKVDIATKIWLSQIVIKACHTQFLWYLLYHGHGKSGEGLLELVTVT